MSAPDPHKIAAVSRRVGKLLQASAALETDVGVGAMSSRDFLIAAIGALSSLCADALPPDAASARVLADKLIASFETGLNAAIAHNDQTRRYAELDLGDIAKKAIVGETLTDREAEFALVMKIIDREGAVNPDAVRVFGGGA